MRGMDMLDGLGLVPWIGWLGIVVIREGVGSAQLVYFGGVGIVCVACIRLGGVGLISWTGWLGIVTIREGVGSAQLVYFGGVGIVCAAWIRWGAWD